VETGKKSCRSFAHRTRIRLRINLEISKEPADSLGVHFEIPLQEGYDAIAWGNMLDGYIEPSFSEGDYRPVERGLPGARGVYLKSSPCHGLLRIPVACG
jgi:hypothetical protein